MKCGAYFIRMQWKHCPHHATCYHMCSDVMRASHGAHAGKPATLIIHGVRGITYGCAIRTGQTIFIKNNRLTF